MTASRSLSRREFLGVSAGFLLGSALPLPAARDVLDESLEPVIDIHQHTHYSGRTNAQLIAHQRAMGVSRTILLPAGSRYGLAADCYGNASVIALAREHPEMFRFFANEVADLPGATRVIEKVLKQGAIGIGEQKFRVACDSPSIEAIAELAGEYHVPILMHFQHGTYNTHIERFHRILEKFPHVNFIGHAQTWWANIDKHCDPAVMYPQGPVTPGGITDRLLTDYPNMYGDHSAGSGLNALLRDEDHARAFLERHQDKLLFGSDCNDTLGRGPACQGAEILATLRRLAPTHAIERKILCHNAKRLFGW